MVHYALSEDHMIQLKVVTGTSNSQKYQDEILESGVWSSFGLARWPEHGAPR